MNKRKQDVPLKKDALRSCDVCGFQMSAFGLDCPECGTRNPEFFRIPKVLRGQMHLDVWADEDVHRAAMKAAIKANMSVSELYVLAMEEYLTALAKKGAR